MMDSFYSFKVTSTRRVGGILILLKTFSPKRGVFGMRGILSKNSQHVVMHLVRSILFKLIRQLQKNEGCLLKSGARM